MPCTANTPNTSNPCVSLHKPCAPRMRSSQMSFTTAPGNHRPWVQQQWKTRARHRVTTSASLQPPVFAIFTRNRFAPLHETGRDAVIVRHIRATLAKVKVHTHCFPGAHILDRFIVASLRHTCAIIMLSNKHLDMPHLWGGWIISAKDECSLTPI